MPLENKHPPKTRNKARIPRGLYCYTVREIDKSGSIPVIKTKMCPYWDRDLDKPEQANGYCHFLGKGDWDINATTDPVIIRCKQHPEYEGKHASECPDIPQIGWGLLWDQCKECGINEGCDDDVE